MTTEELLKPRYKVIADYPGNLLKVGSVIVTSDVWKDFTVKFWCEANDKFPHLFKKLEWWEEREEKDMPEYVKSVNNSKIGKVIKWDLQENFASALVDNYWWFTPFVLPATREEYEQSKK